MAPIVETAEEATFGTELSGEALEDLCVDTIRFLAIDAVEKAQSGHPGMPMGMADAAWVLWTEFLRVDPNDPDWLGRDRFILSNGHGSMLLYACLHLAGFPLPMEQLRAFRQWQSLTPGHPENHITAGVETTTGPLGQGFGNAVGMALARKHLRALYGEKAVNHRIFGFCSDGDLMEGVASEAASLAGHLKLGSLVFCYDDNRITIDGSTDLAFSEDVPARFRSYNWHVIPDVDGHDRDAIRQALEDAVNETERPSLICLKTHIGYGAPTKQDSASSHGSPLGAEEVRGTKENAGWPLSPTFFVPQVVRDQWARRREEWATLRQEWEKEYHTFKDAHPEDAARFEARMKGRLPEDWEASFPTFDPDPKGMATRKASGTCLQPLTDAVPALIGGSADLTGSNKTEIKDSTPFSADNPTGRNLHFGVREHAMGSMLNGMALHGGVIPYGGTFLIFSDYMRPAIRLAGLMEVGPIYVFTHDSIFLGEDGPTHQPIEHLASLRAIVNLVTLRPADANEVADAWQVALRRDHGPTALVLTRQSLPVLDRQIPDGQGVHRGAYVIWESDDDLDVILMASGSEVHVVLEAGKRLADEGFGVRVVSFPSWELFESQEPSYRSRILPPAVAGRLAVEAARPQGWERYVGPLGETHGMDRFGASAPYKDLQEQFGFTADAIFERAREYLAALPDKKAALRERLGA